MSDQNEDKLSALLADGWSIAGYSTTIMAAGAMTHSVLLQKGAGLAQVTVVINAGKELGRNFSILAPMPAAKKGWF